MDYGWANVPDEESERLAELKREESEERYRHTTKPSSPALRKCKKCGVEFFEIKASEPCPSCGSEETSFSSQEEQQHADDSQ